MLWQGQLDETAVMLNGALDCDPDSPEAHTNIGIIYARQGRIEEAAIAHKKAKAITEAKNNLGVVYCQQGKIDEAITEFNAAIETGNLKEAHTNLSILTAGLENIEAANLQTSPVGAPIGVPAVWCEIVD